MSDPLLHVAAAPSETGAVPFEEFYEREKSALFGALCLVTRNRHEAEELTQDAFLAVYERWDRVAGMENPSGYLYRVAMITFRSWNRRVAMGTKRAVGLTHPDNGIGEIEAEDVVVRALAR